MKLYNKFNKIASLLYKIIFYLTSAILSWLILSSLVFTVYMPLSAKERIEFSYSTWYFPILIFLFILLLFKGKIIIEKISSNKLFLILSVVYFVLGLFLIIRIVGGLRADASIVFNAAVDFNNGNFSSLTEKGAYLYVYPHQLGLTTFDRIYAFFFQFFKNERIIYFFNLLFILGTNFFIYKISLKLFKNKLVTNYTIILSFLFFLSAICLWNYTRVIFCFIGILSPFKIQ